MGILSKLFGGNDDEQPNMPTFDTNADLRKLRAQNDLFQVNAFGDQNEQDSINQFYTGEEVEAARGKVLQQRMNNTHLCRSCGNMHARGEAC